MKYVDSEKLIAEIEGLLKLAQYNEENDGDFFFSGEIQGYKNILTIITSLLQEQPDVDLEKAARYVYESWMGGTMDDVRRDMVELGKVIKARNKE